jgi:hypothetical protein
MIIDSHAHIFPQFGADSEGQSGELQLKFIQHPVQFHVQGWRKRSDGSRCLTSPLAPAGDGLDDLRSVNFKSVNYGRLECTVDGEDYYLQWYPCSLRDNAAPPELLIAYMDYLGVDAAILQHDHVYGCLNAAVSKPIISARTNPRVGGAQRIGARTALPCHRSAWS